LLIFDCGMHNGDDTEFYLKKGFRVVAIEADQKHCDAVSERLGGYIADGRLIIVNKAIASEPGEVTFYDNQKYSVWGTIKPDWAARNDRMGATSISHTITATTMRDLLSEYGVPYYVKIDIEGLDTVALADLGSQRDRPKYVSIESDKASYGALKTEFAMLQALGYDKFKIVPQQNIDRQKLPSPPREGGWVDHHFPKGSSGAFGEEAPGVWLTADQAIERYRKIFIRYMLLGDDKLIRNRVVTRLLWEIGVRAGWHDTHAKLSD
jgi:FkbM family methyltransferase